MGSFWKCLVLVSLAYFHHSESRLTLHLEDTLYLPYEYSPIPRFEYNMNTGGRVQYDPTHKFAYVAGNDLIHVIDLFDIRHLDNIYHIREPDHHFKDIKVCNDYVLAAANDVNDPDSGKLFIFKTYNLQSEEMLLVRVIQLEHNPSQIAITNDCSKVLVSLEGEAYTKDGTFHDPEAGVSFMHFPSGNLGEVPNQKFLDFTAFNALADDYIQRGVRHVYENSTFSQDLEPEGITINYNEQIAYVGLQENNAIAEIDIGDFATARIVELFPLGAKAWHEELMDPSDWDQSIRLGQWKIFGLYQPDDVRYFEVDNIGYLLCANEGHPKEYQHWTEVKRGQDFMLEGLVHSGVSQELKDYLLTTSNLGRLEFSTVNGKEADGTYSDFYSFGSRSWSIRLAANPSQIVYDSGSLTGKHHETLAPIMFNNNPDDPRMTMLQSRDTRSDNRGAEPEVVEVGNLDGEKILFIGNERSSSVEIYSVRHGVSSPLFHNITYGSKFMDVGKTWEMLYTEHNVGDLEPEGLDYKTVCFHRASNNYQYDSIQTSTCSVEKFIEPRYSPILQPLLLVSGTISGTISCYVVSRDDEIDDDKLATKVDDLYTHADKDANHLLDVEEHIEMIMEADVDNNHRVDKVEFFNDYKIKVGLMEDKLDFVFNELDVDNNRYLNAHDSNILFYLCDRDATSRLTRDQFGREWKRILYGNIDLDDGGEA